MPVNEENSASLPKTGTTCPPDTPRWPKPGSPTFARDFKSHLRNILLTSPYFTGFYTDILASEGVNPNEARILAKGVKKIWGQYPALTPENQNPHFSRKERARNGATLPSAKC